MRKSLIVLISALLLFGVSEGRNVNDASLRLIKSFEGFFKNFYIDPVGIRTIGYGHACHVWDCNNLIARNSAGQTRTVRAPLSEVDAADLLRNDLGKYGDCVENGISVTMNDNQFGALVSFTFNVGCGGFGGSSLKSSINAGSSASTIRANFMKWNKGGGRVLAGLTRRRGAEADLYLGVGNSGGSGGGSGDDGIGQACTQPQTGDKGVCSTTCTGGTQVSGLCPGDANVKCCIGQTCTSSGKTGKCRDTTDCKGTSLSGGCPGDASYKCCVDENPQSQITTFPCPTGATFDAKLGFCKDSLNMYGPFTNQMSSKCVANGGGEVSCRREIDVTVNGVTAKVQRWALSLQNIRGDGQCPLGTAVDSNYMGHCTEVVNGKVNVFGPFAKSTIDACRAASGGSACFTIRWSGAFFRSVAIGASYQPFNVTEEDDPTVELFPQALIDEQIELSKETIVPDSARFIAPLTIVVLFFATFAYLL